MAQLLECSFERSVYHKIRVFEAERVKELYARMLQTSHKLPDFKTRLLELQVTKGDNLPGFRKVRNTSANKVENNGEKGNWIKAYQIEDDVIETSNQVMKPHLVHV